MYDGLVCTKVFDFDLWPWREIGEELTRTLYFLLHIQTCCSRIECGLIESIGVWSNRAASRVGSKSVIRKTGYLIPVFPKLGSWSSWLSVGKYVNRAKSETLSACHPFIIIGRPVFYVLMMVSFWLTMNLWMPWPCTIAKRLTCFTWNHLIVRFVHDFSQHIFQFDNLNIICPTYSSIRHLALDITYI